MDDLNDMSRAARSAAMRGGVAGWGEVGSGATNIRYIEPRQKRPGRQPKCHCGCEGAKTSVGFANGVALMSGCELSVRRWVKGGRS